MPVSMVVFLSDYSAVRFSMTTLLSFFHWSQSRRLAIYHTPQSLSSLVGRKVHFMHTHVVFRLKTACVCINMTSSVTTLAEPSHSIGDNDCLYRYSLIGNEAPIASSVGSALELLHRSGLLPRYRPLGR